MESSIFEQDVLARTRRRLDLIYERKFLLSGKIVYLGEKSQFSRALKSERGRSVEIADYLLRYTFEYGCTV
jgi:hypothetical protein